MPTLTKVTSHEEELDSHHPNHTSTMMAAQGTGPYSVYSINFAILVLPVHCFSTYFKVELLAQFV